MLVKRMKLLWQCSVRAKATPPNISCNAVMIYFQRSAWESCSPVCSWDKRVTLGTFVFALLVEQHLLGPWYAPIPAPLLSHSDPLLWIAAIPLPLQVKSNIFGHGSFPASSKLASFLLLRPEFMKLFPKLNSCT